MFDSRTSSLSPISIVVMFVAVSLPAAFTLDPTTDHDTWWHLRVGQVISETQRIPTQESFSRLGQEQPTTWVAYSWLYELGLYQVYSQSGLHGLYWARSVLGIFSTGFIVWVGLRKGISRLTLCNTMLACIVLMPLMKERPWHITIGFTVIVIALISDLRQGGSVRRAWWLPLVFVIWANIHIQFVLGWMILGLACCLPGQANRTHLVVLTLGCVLATFLTPHHVRCIQVIWEYGTQTGPLGSVKELSPPDWDSPWTVACLAMIGLGVLVLLRKKPFDWFEFILLVIATILFFRMRRDIWLPAIVTSSIVGRSLQSETVALRKHVLLLIVSGAFLGIRGLNCLGVGPSPNFEAANTRMFPVKAVQFLRENPAPGPLFNSFDWGGYLIWALPEHPVSLDGRTNLYGSERLTRSFRTWNAEPGWDADPDLMTAKMIIAPRAKPLSSALRERPTEWKIVYEDELTIVFVR